MRFANINGFRAEPAPTAKGLCPNCGGEAIAKCGEHMLWHWAHKTREHCDRWWENETEWHRAWKNRFPAEWQEIAHVSPTGERHVADIRTPAGLVIELQRSTIHPDEVRAREAYYGKMIWVIDGCRNANDPANFGMSRSDVRAGNGYVGFRWPARNKLFDRWHSLKPVFIDFGEAHGFWRIGRFDLATRRGIAVITDRNAFVHRITMGDTDFSEGGGPATVDAET